MFHQGNFFISTKIVFLYPGEWKKLTKTAL